VDLELRAVTKRFPGVIANDDVNLTARSGRVLALIGENGAGKSTLMNILSGLYRPDAGEILLDGVSQSFDGPGDSIAAGIGMVYQHFMLVPVLTVYENVILGIEPVGVAGILRRNEARERVREISTRYGLAVDPDAIIETLPVGLQQRVEIIKILLRGAKILVFDEPTAVLTPQEVDEFFRIVVELRQRGATVIFITHKLKEALAVADDIVVMRGGRVVGEANPADATPETLAKMMVGRDVELKATKSSKKPGSAVLEVERLTCTDDAGHEVVKGASFVVNAGEIVGIAGIQGNGQTELINALTGIALPVDGQVRLVGRDITKMTPRQRHRLGVAHVPEDRTRAGMVGAFTVAENLVLDSYYDEPYSRRGIIQRKVVATAAEQMVNNYDVRPNDVNNLARALSGGNAQKMIVAREFSRDVPLVVCSQPTRGIDVGSIEYIHQRIVEKRDEGKAILIVSTELDEIFALSDRILVMFEGVIVAELLTAETDPLEVGLYMAGRHRENVA
jgi:simple sugar transport system ATP-binding protein